MFSSSYRQAKPRNEGPLQRTDQIIFRILKLGKEKHTIIHYKTRYITNIYYILYVIYCSGNARGLPAGPRHPTVAPCCTTGPDSYTGFRTSCFCRTSWHGLMGNSCSHESWGSLCGCLSLSHPPHYHPPLLPLPWLSSSANDCCGSESKCTVPSRSFAQPFFQFIACSADI